MKRRWSWLLGCGVGLLVLSPSLFPALAVAGWALFGFGAALACASAMRIWK